MREHLCIYSSIFCQYLGFCSFVNRDCYVNMIWVFVSGHWEYDWAWFVQSSSRQQINLISNWCHCRPFCLRTVCFALTQMLGVNTAAFQPVWAGTDFSSWHVGSLVQLVEEEHSQFLSESAFLKFIIHLWIVLIVIWAGKTYWCQLSRMMKPHSYCQ